MKKNSLERIILSGLFIFLIAIAGTVDYHRVVNYLFGDEAVYYMMAQSFAGDLDLEYSQKDLMRVYNDGWHAGPQGVFLTKLEDGKIYYAKSFAYSLLLAPFLAAFGMNGFLILNMLMLFLTILMGWFYLRQFNPSLFSLLTAMTFFILSGSFVYSFWMTPEIFNMFCITLGLFLWLYERDQQHASGGGQTFQGFALAGRLKWLLLTPQGRIYLAPIPIAVAGASKLPNILFVLPILADLLLEVWLRMRKSSASVRPGRALLRHRSEIGKIVRVGLIFAAALLLFYGLQYLFIGHFNQYAGDRKSFYWEFPLESGKEVWEQGVPSSNDDYFEQAFYYRSKVLLSNIYYYLFGRFTGILPYFCCAFLAVYYFLRARRASRAPATSSRKRVIFPGELSRRIFLLLTIGASIMAYIVLAPSNYQGGGGAFGNRFFVNIYPGFFFLMTSLSGILPLMVSWLVGSCFLAQVLINPFQYSSYPAMQAFRFPYRLLPVELTLLNTLPTNLSPSLVQGEPPAQHPTHKLYFFDENAADRSPHEFWARGRSRADLALRAFDPGDWLSVTIINGPIGNTVDVTVGDMTQTARFGREREERRLVFPLRNPLPFFRSSAYPMSIRSHEGFVPKFVAGTGLNDPRFLGCRVELSLDPFETGKTLFAQGRFQEALTEFERSLEKSPQHIYARYYLGRTYQALNRNADALQNIETAKKLLPGFRNYFHIICRENNERCPFSETSPEKIASPRNRRLADVQTPLTLRFEAEELSRNTGRVVADSQASGGKLVEFRAKEDARGFQAYGQRITLPAGEYQARYRVKAVPVEESEKPQAEIAFWYDVYSGKKQGILQKGGVSLSALQRCGSEDFRDYVLNFELARPASLEFRLESSGSADVSLDKIEVVSRLPLQIFQALAELTQTQGLQKEAESIFRQVLAFDAASPEVLSNYLDTLINLRRWDDALEFLQDSAECSESRSGLLGRLSDEGRVAELPPVFRILQEKLLQSFSPDIPLKHDFEQLIEFSGYSLSAHDLSAGQGVQMQFFWKALADIPDDYHVLLYLVGKNDFPASLVPERLKRRFGLSFVNGLQPKHQPLHGSYPSSQWLPGELLKESYEIQLPSELRPGSYELRLGLWNPLTKQRLRSQGKEDIVLGDIEVNNGSRMD